MVLQVPFPDAVAELGLLERVSYRDAFLVETPEDRPAEEWVRLALAGAPPLMLSGVRSVQTILGLELAPASREHPLGWDILRNDPDLFILGADGPGGSARLAAVVANEQLMLTTQAAFGRRTRMIWTVAQFPHRAIARYLMGKAVR